MTVELIANTPNPEEVIAKCASTCYDSGPKTIEGARKMIKALIKSGHTSTIEHASVTFRISGISRVVSHELVRHRIASYSQRSQRYVNEEDPKFFTPYCIDKEFTAEEILDENSNNAKLSAAKKIYEDFIKQAFFTYKTLIGLGLKKEDARYVLPNATHTTICMTMNFRTLRNFLKLRLSKRAQPEIREMANLILQKLLEIAPSCFEDLEDEENWQNS